MRAKRLYIIITFASTTNAMAMEMFCNTHQLAGRLIPVPQEISAGCGLAWRVPAEEFTPFSECETEWRALAEQIVELTM